MTRLYYSSKNPCTAALPLVRVQLPPQCICKSTKYFGIKCPQSKKSAKSLEDKRKMPFFVMSNIKFGYPGKFPERASRIRHYPF